MILLKVGRYKFNKKLNLKNRISGHVLAEDVVDVPQVKSWQKQEQSDKRTGNYYSECGCSVCMDQAEERKIKVLSNMMVDLMTLC